MHLWDTQRIQSLGSPSPTLCALARGRNRAPARWAASGGSIVMAWRTMTPLQKSIFWAVVLGCGRGAFLSVLALMSRPPRYAAAYANAIWATAGFAQSGLAIIWLDLVAPTEVVCRVATLKSAAVKDVYWCLSEDTQQGLAGSVSQRRRGASEVAGWVEAGLRCSSLIGRRRGCSAAVFLHRIQVGMCQQRSLSRFDCNIIRRASKDLHLSFSCAHRIVNDLSHTWMVWSSQRRSCWVAGIRQCQYFLFRAGRQSRPRSIHRRWSVGSTIVWRTGQRCVKCLTQVLLIDCDVDHLSALTLAGLHGEPPQAASAEQGGCSRSAARSRSNGVQAASIGRHERDESV